MSNCQRRARWRLMTSLLVNPKSEKDFWTIIEETFVQIEGALTSYPAETRDEAIAGTQFKDASLSFICYRPTSNSESKTAS
jgi:hypothetical protein